MRQFARIYPESIRENGGIINPIVVNKRKDGTYELLAQELAKRMARIELREIEHLRDDLDASSCQMQRMNTRYLI